MAINDWEMLEGSYWHVPTPYLGAFALVDPAKGVVAPLVDQTVWRFDKVVDGYIFGEAATTVGKGWVYSKIVGSISPTGSVLFSFTQADGSLTLGSGKMTHADGAWLFEMQMTTKAGAGSVSHWAYMAEVDKGDRAWTMLPGFTGTGVPQIFDGDASNDAGASQPQRIRFGGDGDNQLGAASAKAAVLLYGEGGRDQLIGGRFNDGLVGGRGDDAISGNGGADDLYGQSGNDRLSGGSGADLVNGGTGQDRLCGGAGADIFVFSTRADSRPGLSDLIVDFAHAQGDRLDFRDIDARRATGADDAFRFVGAAAFSGMAGELRTQVHGDDLAVLGDTDGDRQADFVVRLADVSRLVGSDFLL